MSLSSFRKELEDAFRQHGRVCGPGLLASVGAILRSRGLIHRVGRGWEASRLDPVLSAVWDRSSGDPELAALLACEWFSGALALDIVGQGLLSGDIRALEWLKRAETRSPGAGFSPR